MIERTHLKRLVCKDSDCFGRLRVNGSTGRCQKCDAVFWMGHQGVKTRTVARLLNVNPNHRWGQAPTTHLDNPMDQLMYALLEKNGLFDD